MLSQPAWIVLGDYCSDMKEVTVVKVMIVEVAVTKVDPDIRGAFFADNTAPSGFISRESLVGSAEPAVERGFEVLDNGVDKILASNMVTAYKSVWIQ